MSNFKNFMLFNFSANDTDKKVDSLDLDIDLQFETTDVSSLHEKGQTSGNQATCWAYSCHSMCSRSCPSTCPSCKTIEDDKLEDRPAFRP